MRWCPGMADLSGPAERASWRSAKSYGADPSLAPILACPFMTCIDGVQYDMHAIFLAKVPYCTP